MRLRSRGGPRSGRRPRSAALRLGRRGLIRFREGEQAEAQRKAQDEAQDRRELRVKRR